jgi:N-acetylmuramic acid 6-phosphate (MurNAc-6-P) etherase
MIRRTDLMNTETLDPRYRDLDLWPTQLAVEAMLEGQMAAIAALQSQTAAIAAAAEQAAQRLGTDGRLVLWALAPQGASPCRTAPSFTPPSAGRWSAWSS